MNQSIIYIYIYIPLGEGSVVFYFKTGLGNNESNESVNSCVNVSSSSILGAGPPNNIKPVLNLGVDVSNWSLFLGIKSSFGIDVLGLEVVEMSTSSEAIIMIKKFELRHSWL